MSAADIDLRSEECVLPADFVYNDQMGSHEVQRADGKIESKIAAFNFQTPGLSGVISFPN